jgi:hypothetical protein
MASFAQVLVGCRGPHASRSTASRATGRGAGGTCSAFRAAVRRVSFVVRRSATKGRLTGAHHHQNRYGTTDTQHG